MFLETLVDFIIIHKDDLQDWLFVLLTQLLKKMGADLLGSVQAKVQKALDVTRQSTQMANVTEVFLGLQKGMILEIQQCCDFEGLILDEYKNKGEQSYVTVFQVLN